MINKFTSSTVLRIDEKLEKSSSKNRIELYRIRHKLDKTRTRAFRRLRLAAGKMRTVATRNDLIWARAAPSGTAGEHEESGWFILRSA